MEYLESNCRGNVEFGFPQVGDIRFGIAWDWINSIFAWIAVPNPDFIWITNTECDNVAQFIMRGISTMYLVRKNLH